MLIGFAGFDSILTQVEVEQTVSQVGGGDFHALISRSFAPPGMVESSSLDQRSQGV